MKKLSNAPAEFKLIGSCLKNPDTINSIIDIISPSDFADVRMGTLYSTIARVALKETITPVAVVEELRLSGELDSVGGDKSISWLLNHGGNLDECIEAARTIRELSIKRDQARTARKLAETIEDGADPLKEIATLSEIHLTKNDEDGFTDLTNVIESIFSGTHRRLEPTLLKRSDDNENILYGEGRLNLIAAPPESMKSWLGKLCCVQEMIKGNSVIYLDAEESDGITCSERILAIAGGLGIEKDQLRDWLEGPINPDTNMREKNKKLFYYKPLTTGIDAKIRGQVMRVLRQRKCSFIVLDGFASAMANHEPPLEEDRARDVNMFLSGSIWPMTLAPSKPGVLIIDHVSKASGSSGQTSFQNRGPRGSGAKLASVSGVALQAKVIQAGSAFQNAIVELYVVKDRPGRCKIVPRSGGKRIVGVLKSTPLKNGNIEITKLEIISPEASEAEQAEKRWDLIAAEKISDILYSLTTPIAKGEITKMLNERKKENSGSGWRTETITKAITFLVENGWAKIEKDGRFEKIALLYPYKAEMGGIHISEKDPF